MPDTPECRIITFDDTVLEGRDGPTWEVVRALMEVGDHNEVESALRCLGHELAEGEEDKILIETWKHNAFNHLKWVERLESLAPEDAFYWRAKQLALFHRKRQLEALGQVDYYTERAKARSG